MGAVAPPPGTVERWCHELVTTRELRHKLAPPEPPDPARAESWTGWKNGYSMLAPTTLRTPGRAPELVISARSPRTRGARALVRRAARARLVHTFLHHEVQAAELFAWAILAFPDTPLAFRQGLVRLCLEELEHGHLYANHLAELDTAYGDYPVRDWFWERVGSCASPLAFVALMGVGLEGANLEHTARFAGWFREAGDERGARILERVEREEVAHVAFARRWFERLAGHFDYERWSAALPDPLTPSILRGTPLNRVARARAGLSPDFLDRLAAAPPTGR